MLKLLHPSAQKSKLFIVTMNEQTLHHRVCTVDGCGNKAHNPTLCKKHYNKVYKAAWFANPVNYWIRYFHNRLYYRMPGVAHRALLRSRTTKARMYRREFSKKWGSTPKGAWIRRAHSAVKSAIRAGDINRQACEICGDETRVHAHHDSYLAEKWLSVRWLCTKHHGEWHRVNKPIMPDPIPDLPKNARSPKFSSKFRGVIWVEPSKKWRAALSDGKKKYNLGHFTDEKEAARAVNKAILQYKPKDMRLNVV